MATDFITFEARGRNAEYTVRLKQPVPLFDETHSGYRAARARAARHLKRELGLHPCSKIEVEPRDWSDGVGTLTERTTDAADAAAYACEEIADKVAWAKCRRLAEKSA